MNRTYRQVLKRLTPATALVVATGLAATGLASGSTAAATETPSAPALKLVVSTTTQTVTRYPGEPVYLFDLGIHAVAEQAAFEVRTLRGRSYRDPIKATLTLGTGAGKKTTTLPSTLFTDVNNLNKFLRYTITNQAGKVVKAGQEDFCPSSRFATRVIPTGAATNPYPEICGAHPFNRGGVLGLQRGWSVPAFNNSRDLVSFEGEDGVYTLRVVIRAPWRKALGLTTAQSKAKIKIKMETWMEGTHAGSTTTPPAQREAARQKSTGPTIAPHTAPPTTTTRTTDIPANSKPDLRALPAQRIQLSPDPVLTPNKTYLNFSATVWNAGAAPLVVDGFRTKPDKSMAAFQYFYDTAGNEVGSAPAGTLPWNPTVGHEHWHFPAFSAYRLLDKTRKLTKRSGRETTCVRPIEPVNLNSKHAIWQLDEPVSCAPKMALNAREALEPGWGHTTQEHRLSRYVAGQSFDVSNLANGIYFIEVRANPDRKLTESNLKNNRALRKIKIGGKVGGERTLKVYDYAGIKAP